MAQKPSPLKPGAYGKPQRWHEILADGARTRAEKREEQRRRNDEAATETVLSSGAISTFLTTMGSIFR